MWKWREGGRKTAGKLEAMEFLLSANHPNRMYITGRRRREGCPLWNSGERLLYIITSATGTYHGVFLYL